MALAIYQDSKNQLPKNVVILAQFDQQMPKPQSVFLIQEKSGQFYFPVVGPLPGFPALASANPNYIFDAKGRIVDWTEDPWNDSSFQEPWTGSVKVRAISMQQAIEMVQRKEKETH